MKGKTALITGATGHVGRSVSTRLAEAGVNVLLLDKNDNALGALANELSSNSSVAITQLLFDLEDLSCMEELSEKVISSSPNLDFIVNNAAFYDEFPGWGVGFQYETYEAWERVFRVNLFAPFFLVQKLVPLLQKSECASIVNVSSMYSEVAPNPALYLNLDMTNPAAYCASKGGLNQLTRWLSAQLAPHIRVNTVSPGGIERGQDPIFIERYNSKTPLARMAKNEDVSASIFFLLSREAQYITGQNLFVDGGWSVW